MVDLLEIIGSLSAIFIAASVMLFLFDRLKHPSIPAYIIAGIFVQPFVNEANILSFAEVGIAFLVFIFGSSLKLGDTERVIRENILLTVVQVFAVAVPVYFTSYLLGVGIINSLYLAVAASLSSSLVGMELIGGDTVKLAYRRLCNSVNLIQDLLAVILFLFLASFPLTLEVISNNLFLGCIILSIGLVARPIMPYILEFVERSRETTMLMALSTILLFTGLSQYYGISIVIGSFAAGLALSRPPYDKEILDTVESLKDFFSAIFFVSLGALLVVPGLEVLMIATGLILVISLLRPILVLILVQLEGFSKGISYMLALNLDQMSEFALILAIHAYMSSYISPVVFQSIILAGTVTMVVSSYTSRHVWQIYEYVQDHMILSITEKNFVESAVSEEEEHFVIGGYDVQGKELADFLVDEGKDVIVIDNDPERILEAREEGVTYVYGDMMIDEVWEEARFDKAKMIILTAPMENLARKVIGLETDADKIVRANTIREAKKFIDDCLYVIVPHFLAAKRLVEHLKGSLESDDYRERLRKISRRELEG